MLCDNCGKKEANVKYSENINGVKREFNLCEECSKKLGIGEINFKMPIDFSSFFVISFMEILWKILQHQNLCHYLMISKL